MDLASQSAEIESLKTNVKYLLNRVSDLEQRFDTLQTPFIKRIGFWLDGWPWHDLNAPKRNWRPWHNKENQMTTHNHKGTEVIVCSPNPVQLGLDFQVNCSGLVPNTSYNLVVSGVGYGMSSDSNGTLVYTQQTQGWATGVAQIELRTLIKGRWETVATAQEVIQ